MKNIMLACVAGMSTSLLVDKMQKEAQAQKLDVEIFAVPMTEAADYVEKKNVDVILLGPQVRFMLNEYEEKFKSKGIPVAVIPMTDYGMMNGAKVLAQAMELIGA